MKSVPVRRDSTRDQEELILPFPGPRKGIPTATAFRSTWVVSSLESLRSGGPWERYLEQLLEHRDEVLSSVAGVWLPMSVARAHYRACDALGLSSEEVAALGRGPGGQVRRAWYATFIAAVGKPDASAWPILSQLDRMWQRSANGGAVAVFRLGARQVRIEYVGCELFDIPYFRQAVRTVLLALADHFGGRSVVRTVPQPTSDECHYHMQWS
jgi:hypothetical protein